MLECVNGESKRYRVVEKYFDSGKSYTLLEDVPLGHEMVPDSVRSNHERQEENKIYLEKYVRENINPFNPDVEDKRVVYGDVIAEPYSDEEALNENGRLILIDLFTEESIKHANDLFVRRKISFDEYITCRYSFASRLPEGQYDLC